MVAGTLTYVAPEQLRGEPLTPAADVYSLAVLAYQLLLGAPPFAAREDRELVRKHLQNAPPAPSTRWPEIPADLELLLLGMLAKRPADRPTLADAVQVLDAAPRRARAAPRAPPGARDPVFRAGTPPRCRVRDRRRGALGRRRVVTISA